MTFPSFVQTREASIGTAALLISSDLLVIQVSITPSRGLVWDATGDRFEASTWTTEGNLGESITMTLPCTDVAGWRDSVTGALIDVSAPDSYTHTYTGTIRFLDSTKRSIGKSVTLRPFVLPRGDGSTVDLDKLLPVPGVAGGSVLVPDSWSALVADAVAAAAAIGNADNLLTGTVADARLPVTAQAATLAATFGGLPAAYIDPRTMADGAVTTLSRGTLSASYGNSPAAISSGRIVHTPLTGANSAAYVEANLSGPARRIGAIVEWPAATGTLALVLPSGSWLGGITNAGVHATVTAAGTVSSGRYISPGGLVGTQTAAVGALTGRHTFEVGVDTRLQQITVWLDGKRILKYTDAAAFANLATYAIWELFEPNGTSDTPVIIHSAWADVEQVIPPSPIGTDVTPQAPTTSAIVATTGTYPITTSIASIGMGSVTATYPSSGKILARYSCWVDATAATGVVFGSQNAIGAQKIAGAGFVGRVTCETIMVGTPGASVTITPRMWTSAGTASVTVGGSAGDATISAINLR